MLQWPLSLAAAEADIAVILHFISDHAQSVARDLTPILLLGPTAGKKRFKLLAEYELFCVIASLVGEKSSR